MGHACDNIIIQYHMHGQVAFTIKWTRLGFYDPARLVETQQFQINSCNIETNKTFVNQMFLEVLDIVALIWEL